MSIYTQGVTSRLSLRVNFSWYFVGNLVYAGCQWGIFVTLAKLGSPEMVGQFALGLAITAPVMMFASLRMRLVQATDAKREYLFADYLGLRIITTILALLVIAGIVLVAKYPLEIALIILGVAMAKALEGISDTFYGLLQQHERLDRIAKSLMMRGPLSLVALSLGVYLTGSVFWGTMGLLATWALVLFSYDIPSGALMLRSMPDWEGPAPSRTDQRAMFRLRWDRRKLFQLACLTLPLGFVVMQSSLLSNIPRYFIEQHLGMAELGIFVTLAYFERAGNMVVKALAQAASPRLGQYHAAGKSRDFQALLFKLTGTGMLLGAGGLVMVFVAGEEILSLLYQPEYAQQDLFLRLMVAAGMSYVATFLIYGVSAARIFQLQAVLSTVVTISLLLACIFLIPSGGLLGAAMALIIARGVQLIGSLIIIGFPLRALDGDR